ncbi:hypothetical protein SB18R_03100 [Pseudomonas oryzihabitans]|nr:hypothetical protein SB9_12335 [Pseudomonas psychrotolerans]KTT78235.1 hypothetical protein SB18R_03100 [Pseudomonas psychrotolerans]
MTTAPIPSIADDQLEEIAGRTTEEALAHAERRGFTGFPYRASRELNAEGEMLWVHRYRLPDPTCIEKWRG